MEPWWLFWNTPAYARQVFFSLLAISFLIFILGFRRNLKIWEKGIDSPDDPIHSLTSYDLLKLSIITFFSPECIFARRLRRISLVRSIILVALIFSSILLFTGVFLNFVDYLLPLSIFRGWITSIFEIIFEIGGFFVLVAVIYAIVRKMIASREVSFVSKKDYMPLILILLLILSGFLSEAIRSKVTGISHSYEIVGDSIASLLPSMNIRALRLFHRLFWIIHISSFLVLLAYTPFSHLFHVFSSQITVYSARRREENEFH